MARSMARVHMHDRARCARFGKGQSSCMAPEVLNEHKPHTIKSDVWALGCVLLRAMLLEPEESAPAGVDAMAKQLEATDGYSKGLRDLIKQLLVPDESQRLSPAAALSVAEKLLLRQASGDK